MKNAIEERQARKRSCKHRGCKEAPTISVIVRMLQYPPKPGEHIASVTRSRVFCNDHAKELFETLEDMLDQR